MRYRIFAVLVTAFLAQLCQAANSEPPVRHEAIVGRVADVRLLIYDPWDGRSQLTPRFMNRIMHEPWLMDSHGSLLQVRASELPESDDNRFFSVAAPAPHSPRKAIEQGQLPRTRMHPFALSPDGEKIVFFDFVNDILVIGDNTEFHRIPRKWCLTRPFSWSRDSTKVAFYYAESMDDDDVHVQRHGVAVLDLEGNLTEVVTPEKAVPTPGSFDIRSVPIGWSRSGDAIYYTENIPPSDPRKQGAFRNVRNGPMVTYRLDLKSKEKEEVALGGFADVSPDESYMLLFPTLRQTGDGEWDVTASKVTLDSQTVSYLPEQIRYPKISPSGEQIASLDKGGSICFYRTSDWTRMGQCLERNSPETGSIFVDVGLWSATFRWVTMPATTQPE